MARRTRSEPVWPVFLLIGVVAAGLGIGRAISGPGAADEDIVNVNPGEPVAGAIPGLENRITVEVLNGGGVPGAAARATERLRDAGFDVVYFGNESSFGRDSSVVLERIPSELAPEIAGHTLGITRVRAEPDTTRLVDLTILLGSDWDPEAPLPLPGAALEDADRPWWDIRSWLPRGVQERGD